MSNFCRRCGSVEIVKNGITRGCQRYNCKACDYNFINEDRRKRYSEETKLKAINLVANGLSMNAAAKLFGADGNSVAGWIKKYVPKVAPEPTPPADLKETICVELDEMWHFHQKK